MGGDFRPSFRQPHGIYRPAEHRGLDQGQLGYQRQLYCGRLRLCGREPHGGDDGDLERFGERAWPGRPPAVRETRMPRHAEKRFDPLEKATYSSVDVPSSITPPPPRAPMERAARG